MTLKGKSVLPLSRQQRGKQRAVCVEGTGAVRMDSQLVSVTVAFPIAVTDTATSHLRESFLWAWFRRHVVAGQAHGAHGGGTAGVPHICEDHRTETRMSGLSVFVQFRIPVPSGIVMFIFLMVFPFPDKYSLETSSQTCPEMCLLSDSKSSQIDMEDEQVCLLVNLKHLLILCFLAVLVNLKTKC